MAELDRPIVIVGAARSGTSMMTRVLKGHPDVAFWMEPKYVWKYGRPLAPDDRRGAEDATPRVARYIRNRFEAFRAEEGKPRFMEKTPSNCFRVPFVEAVLPEARFLHVIRDGRAVTRSALRMWTKTPDKRALKRRLTSLDIPLRDAPFYAATIARDVLLRQVMPKKAFVWGPQFPGIREVREAEGVVGVCAVQWRKSVEAALDGFQTVPAERQLTVRFEDLMASPVEKIEEVLDFLQLSQSEAVLDYTRANLHPERAGQYEDGLDPAEIDPYLEPLLSELGYA